MGAVVFFIFISFWTSVFGQIDFDSFEFQTYLDADETVLLAWTVDSTRTNINIALSYPSTGWGAFGVSPTGQMPLSDIAFFWSENNAIFLQDRYTTDNRAEGPLLDTQQNLILLQGEVVDGNTNIVFQRSISPCDDEDDVAIATGTSRVLYAFAQNDASPVMTEYNADNPELSVVGVTYQDHYHGVNRGSKSVNLLDGNDLKVELEADTMTIDVVVDNYIMPSAKTTYYHTYHELLSVNSTDVFHITKFEPIVTAGNELNVHHMVLYYCPTHGVDSDCNTAAYAWAIGAQGMTFPADVGFEMSLDYLSYVKLEIHYDNPDQLSSVIDASGLRIYYTPTLRPHNAGLFEFGLQLGAWQFIPPGMPQAVNKAYCMSECTAATDAMPVEGIYAFNAFLHAHTLGVAIELKHIRNGEELAPLAVNWAYDFDYQQGLPLAQHVHILPGDEFILDCYYDSTQQSGVVYGGESTEEEMCQAYVYVYPRPKVANCLSVFTDTQFNGFYSVATQAGYLTGTSQANYAYDISGDPFTYTDSGSGASITWQNGEDLYNFLWQDTNLAFLSTRAQICEDIDGNQIPSSSVFEIPSGYTPFVADTTCSAIENAVGQIGTYGTNEPTSPTTTTTSGTPSPLPGGIGGTAAAGGYKLCGQTTSDGTSQDVSVDVCVDLDTDLVSITLTGPSDVWFAVGFDAMSMHNAYAVVVHGNDLTECDEYILTQYSAGTTAPFDGTDGVVIESQTEQNEQVIMTVSRDRVSSASGVYSFPNTSTSDINVIFGKGVDTTYQGPMGGHSNVFVSLSLEYVLVTDPAISTTETADAACSFKLHMVLLMITTFCFPVIFM